jgi:ribosome-associated protein
LATRKANSSSGGGGAGRPKLHSSHERAPKKGAKPSRAGKPQSVARASTAAGAKKTLGPRRTRPLPPLPGPRIKKAKGPARPAPSPASSLASDVARDVATAIAVAALDKKAVGLEIVDVSGKVDYADFLVIMTGRSDRQVQALAYGIEDALREKNIRPLAVEGLPHASWVLMDFGDVVVHVFQEETRSLYDIDGLWLDARRVPVPGAPPEDAR